VFPQGRPSFGKWRAVRERLGGHHWLSNSTFVIKPMSIGPCDAGHLSCNRKTTVDIPRYAVRVIEAGGRRQQRVNIVRAMPQHAHSDDARYDNERAANTG
jgi:hypothetical protein